MVTDKQISLIKSLYKGLGQEVENDVENLSKKEASKRIYELLKLLNKLEKEG